MSVLDLTYIYFCCNDEIKNHKMSNVEFDHNHVIYENQMSEIIETSLIDLYGTKGYKSIMQTMIKECRKSEKEITGNYELFADLTHGIFGRVGDTKILDPIKIEIDRIGINDNVFTNDIPL